MSMDSAHSKPASATAGPWIRGEENESRVAVFAGGKTIASVTRGLLVDRAEARANLALILAAPDLLEVAQAMYALMLKGEISLFNGAGGGIWVLPDRFAAAIEKATGAKP